MEGQGKETTTTTTRAGKKPHGNGRKKIPIQKIEKKEALKVTFSKRRKGLFKKAEELSILSGAEVAVIAFSPAGRLFVCSHPSPTPDSLVERFLSLDPSGSSSSSLAMSDANLRNADLRQCLFDLNLEPEDDEDELLDDDDDKEEARVEEMGLEELRILEKELVEQVRILKTQSK